MSAFLCPPEHIGLLAAACARQSPTPEDLVEPMATTLAVENLASLAYHYPKDTGTGDRPGAGLPDLEYILAARADARDLLAAPPPVTTRDLENAVNCYNYQACEHPDWAASAAHHLMAGLALWLEDHQDGKPATFDWVFSYKE